MLTDDRLYNERKDDMYQRKLEIIMQHDMGENWSTYFKTFYENVFHDLGVKTEFDLTENTLVIKIDKDKASSWHR